jgi:amidase
MGLCAIGHGNDVAGSIRFPALQCGVAGLKPTSPPEPAMISVQGPLARSVGDLALALGPMAARDAAPWTGPRPGAPASCRVGVIADIPGLTLAPVMARALGDASRALEEAGYVVEPVEMPDIVDSGKLALRLLMTELTQLVVPVARRIGSAEINWYFDTWINGMSPFLDADAYFEAIALKAAYAERWRRVLETHPMVLLPQRTDPLLEVDEDLRSAEHLQRVLRGYAPSATVNLIGLPSVVVPTGLGDGLPTGVQVVAGPYREDLCLAAASAIEASLGTLADQLWSRS